MTDPDVIVTDNASHARTEPENKPPGDPIFVDMDGTLLKTDMLVESFFGGLRKDPSLLLQIWPRLIKGRAYLKKSVAQSANIDAVNLPYHGELCDYLREQAKSGREIYLATASDWLIAKRVADHCGFFKDVLASDGENNLKGAKKLQAIRERIGNSPFVYAGNAPEDILLWKEASESIVVSSNRNLRDRAFACGPVETSFESGSNKFPDTLDALRPHQWLKNLLVFVPLLASFTFSDFSKLSAALLAFCAFSLVASASYIFNDLIDIGSDRQHPRKMYRPLASGRVSPMFGIALSAGLLVAGLVTALFVSIPFTAMVLLYLAMTTSYSVFIKTRILADALMLAALYTMRVLAGEVAIEVESSTWLLAFSGFVFFSLALVKRCAELKLLEGLDEQSTKGRDYNVSDLLVLWSLGVASAVSSIVVFALFISSPETSQEFATPGLLWFLCPALWYWIGRMWIKTGRGEMHDDPLVFTATDRNSQILITSMVILVLVARFWR